MNRTLRVLLAPAGWTLAFVAFVAIELAAEGRYQWAELRGQNPDYD